MAAFPYAEGVLLTLLAVGCTSPQQSLLRLTVVSLLLLITQLFRAVFRRLSLPFNAAAACTFALGAGTALCLLLRAAFPNLVPLKPGDPVTALLLTACGMTAVQNRPFRWQYLPAAVLIGVIREWLSAGSVWGITLLPLGVSPTLGAGAGGLLIAALVLWCFRCHPPLFTGKLPNGALLAFTALTALGSVLGIVTASFPLLYCLWSITAVCSLIAALLPERYAPDTWVFLLPAAVLLTREATLWWPPVIVGLVVFVGIILLGSLHRRLHLTPPVARFAGTPAALAIAAMLSCLSAALPLTV